MAKVTNRELLHAEEKNLSHAEDVICEIGNVLENWDGEKLAKLHNEVCGSSIIYVGDSLFNEKTFVKSQEILDRVKTIGKELDEHA